MNSEWQSGKLGDFIELKRGYDLAQAKRVPGPYPLVSSAGVSDCHSVPMAKGPGVVTGRYGTIGQVYFVEQDFWPLNTTLYVRDFKGNDPKFISYFLKTVDFLAYSDKAAVPGVNRNHLHEAFAEIPDLGTQLNIAEVLGAFDDRITLLRETNATLEAIAQALFKSWFVDFDPVRAKLAGRNPEGMDEATAALFPDGFEESELGLVPRGWCTSACQDLFDVRDGTHESPKPALVGYPLVTSKHITSGRVNLQGTYLISESDYTAISKRSKVNRLDVLITMIGTVGLSTILLDERNDFAIKNIGLFKTSEAPQFAYFFSILLKSPKMQLYLAARLAGTTQKYLSLTALREMRLLMPTEPILVEFSKIVSPLFDGVQRNHEQAQTLATLRDTLLPRLISGQLRLP